MTPEDHRRVDAHAADETCWTISAFLCEIVERVVRRLLEAEIHTTSVAAPYEHSATRSGHRNCHMPRILKTPVGTLNLLVLASRPIARALRSGGPSSSLEVLLVLSRDASVPLWSATLRLSP